MLPCQTGQPSAPKKSGSTTYFFDVFWNGGPNGPALLHRKIVWGERLIARLHSVIGSRPSAGYARVAQVCADASKSYGLLHRLDRFTSGTGGVEKKTLCLQVHRGHRGSKFESRTISEEEPRSRRSLSSMRPRWISTESTTASQMCNLSYVPLLFTFPDVPSA